MAWVVGFWVVLTLLAAAGGLCAWLASERRGLRSEAGRLAAEAARSEEARARAAQESADLVVRLERAAAEQAGLRQQLEREKQSAQERLAEAKASFDARLEEARQQFDQLQKQAREVFQACAGDALKTATEGLLAQAREAFDGRAQLEAEVWDKRRQSIDSIIKPIRDTLDKHATAVAEIEKLREGAYHGLKQQVASMHEAQLRLQTETANLVTALRRPDVRGKWGETTLRRVVELAGMIPHVDFEEQISTSDGDGKLRPDLIVRLPSGRSIVVDAKTAMVAFLDALGCQDEESRSECLRRHLNQLQQKIGELASKRYQDQFERSPDFTVMFIPIESSLQPALDLEPDLIERAMSRNVVIATPSTLVSLLKAVALGWREEQQAENARRIGQLGQELHKRVGVAIGHVTKMGNALSSTVEHYNRFVGSLEGSLLPQARRFRELGVDSPKELPAEGELPTVDTHPREVKAPEAAAGDAAVKPLA